MTTASNPGADLLAHFDAACELIAPNWPLDQLIAVNPFWELRDRPADDVAARLAALVRSQPLMSPEYYAAQADPPIADRHLEAAAKRMGIDRTAAELRADLKEDDASAHWHNISDLLDAGRDSAREMTWHEEIVHQISQHCAANFQGDAAAGSIAENPGTLYASWLETIRMDHGISILMGEPGLRAQFDALPVERDGLLATAVSELGLTGSAAELYAHALLLDINGWASWVAYLRWQQRLVERDSDLMRDLLAIRIAWDLALWRHVAATAPAQFRRLQALWQRQLAAPAAMIEAHRAGQRQSWLWLNAAEAAYQEHLLGEIIAPQPIAEENEPVLQAAFCIDVRSEVMRRHLEARHPAIQTRGFAGFFGLPLEYKQAGTDYARPQLPGLLAPGLTVQAYTDDQASARTRAKARWSAVSDAPPAMFSLVEATGPLYALKLLRDSFFPHGHDHPVKGEDKTARLELTRDNMPLDTEAQAELAANVLHAMGLEDGFAPVVMLVGHGSSSANNPHAASLDCGACGGQTGSLNARVLARLLNDAEVREALRNRHIDIPERTRFIAALHDTTTDDIELLDGEKLTERAAQWLTDASAAARAERAARLDVAADDPAGLARSLRQRSRDWSQVRPEWGLAGNAAFVVAPRSRTRNANLQGRVFLHDYDWTKDADFSVLELIMTAPMIVTHWINMQYNASVTDNVRYGSGNKVLHNVVGGDIGVFEGNGGDLRIGLPLQSLHDGKQWMHTPLRLSVYLQAPEAAIAAIYRRHDMVRQLVDNDWLYLFRLGDDATGARLYRGDWLPLEGDDAAGIREHAA